MNLYSSIAKTFGRGVYIVGNVEFQDDSWSLHGWIWDRPEFQKEGYTECIYNLAIF